MVRNRFNDQRVLYKFVIYQIKGLVSDHRGKPIYIDAFDSVIEDLYGMKKFARRLSSLYDDRDIADLIDKIGLDQLLDLLKNKSCCNALRDLVILVYDLVSVAKEIRKCQRKEKSAKYLIKEYNDLKKLYSKGIKTLRKRLGIKNIHTAYKRKYGSLRNLINDGNDSSLSWDSDYYDGSFYDDLYDEDDYDDDYDPSDESELEEFLRMMGGGGSRNSRRSRGRRTSRRYYDDDDPYDTEDYDDEEFDDIYTKLNDLEEHIQILSDNMQSTAAQHRYDEVNHRDPISHRYTRQTRQQMQQRRQPVQSNMEADVKDIKEAVSIMIDKMGDQEARLKDIESYMDEEEDYNTSQQNQYYSRLTPREVYDEDDYDPYPPTNRYIRNEPQNGVYNVAPDVVNDPSPPMSRATLVDAINNAPELTKEMLRDP